MRKVAFTCRKIPICIPPTVQFTHISAHLTKTFSEKSIVYLWRYYNDFIAPYEFFFRFRSFLYFTIAVIQVCYVGGVIDIFDGRSLFMSENKSEVARVLEQIELEFQSAQWGLTGLAFGTARHEFITNKMERMGKLHEKLQTTVGEEEAVKLL